jgi:acylphosphatase
MANPSAFQAIIHGRVQGVFFRAFVFEKAHELGLTGCVSNLPSGMDVEVQVEGDRDKLEKLIELIKIGPPLARVDHVALSWSNYSGRFQQFMIGD